MIRLPSDVKSNRIKVNGDVFNINLLDGIANLTLSGFDMGNNSLVFTYDDPVWWKISWLYSSCRSKALCSWNFILWKWGLSVVKVTCRCLWEFKYLWYFQWLWSIGGFCCGCWWWSKLFIILTYYPLFFFNIFLFTLILLYCILKNFQL